jgi:hypothetical protein
MRGHTMRNRTGASFLVWSMCVLPACAGEEQETDVETQGGSLASDDGGPPQAARYRITHHFRSEYANKGLTADVMYRAELRRDPDNPEELTGTGRYEGKVIERKVSIPECDEPPKERTVAGNIEASGSVGEMPDLKGALGLPSKNKSTDPLSGGKVMSYVLATTDWPAPAGASAEDADAGKGLGTVSRLALKLTGKVTKKKDVGAGIHGGNCLGANTITQDITVEEIAP